MLPCTRTEPALTPVPPLIRGWRIRRGCITTGSAARTTMRPVGVLLLAILHFLSSADDPAGIVAALARALAPGSYLVISHLTADLAPAQVGAAVEAYNTAVPGGVVPRSHAEVTALFGGLPLV